MTRTAAADPGAKTTGLIVREGRDCLAVELVERGSDFADYLDAVQSAWSSLYLDYQPDLLAVEGLVKPSPHLGYVDVEWLIDVGQVLGALRTTAGVPRPVVVRPAGFGKVPDLPPGPVLDYAMADMYPDRLLGPREKGGSYGGRLRHARSAWSLSLAAEEQARQVPLFGEATR